MQEGTACSVQHHPYAVSPRLHKKSSLASTWSKKRSFTIFALSLASWFVHWFPWQRTATYKPNPFTSKLFGAIMFITETEQTKTLAHPQNSIIHQHLLSLYYKSGNPRECILKLMKEGNQHSIYSVTVRGRNKTVSKVFQNLRYLLPFSCCNQDLRKGGFS